MKKSVSKEKCQTIIVNLLKQNEQVNDRIAPVSYVRHWQQLVRCAEFSSETTQNEFNNRINDYKIYLNFNNSETYNRIVDYKETQIDEKIAMDAVTHYETDDNRILKNSLRTRTLLYNYYLLQHPGETVGILSAADAGFVYFMKKFFKK